MKGQSEIADMPKFNNILENVDVGKFNLNDTLFL